MKKRIILVGCGNIGSRHLQAIAKLSYEIKVDIVEPNEDAQNLAKSRLDEISFNKKDHKFFWHKSINELTDTGDITIVTTHSVGRTDLILKLLEKGNKRFLIEKMVCQSVNEYNHLLEQMQKYEAKGWVNTNYRYFKGYQNIKNILNNQNIINLSVFTNSKNGMATNSIHFLDLFSWFVGDSKIKLNGELLSNEILENKRGKDFVEFSGIVSGSTKNGNFFSMTFKPEIDKSVIVNISSGNQTHLIVDETNGKITPYGKTEIPDLKFEFEFVSDTTTRVVDDIFTNDSCLLPSLVELFQIHSEVFRVFNTHLNKFSNNDIEICPIT